MLPTPVALYFISVPWTTTTVKRDRPLSDSRPDRNGVWRDDWNFAGLDTILWAHRDKPRPHTICRNHRTNWFR